MSRRPTRSNRVRAVGLVALAVALLGWLGTMVVGAFISANTTVEDLTDSWAPGSTDLGASKTVDVPSGQTLVAFLLGQGLSDASGTTGTCTASDDDGPVALSSHVHLNWSVSTFDAGEEMVAIGGWHNGGDRAVALSVTCTSADSRVVDAVVVASAEASIRTDPWFQPWLWAAIAVVGLTMVVIAAVRNRVTGTA